MFLEIKIMVYFPVPILFNLNLSLSRSKRRKLQHKVSGKIWRNSSACAQKRTNCFLVLSWGNAFVSCLSFWGKNVLQDSIFNLKLSYNMFSKLFFILEFLEFFAIKVIWHFICLSIWYVPVKTKLIIVTVLQK